MLTALIRDCVGFGITYWRRLFNSSKQDSKRKAIANKEKMERADSNQECKEPVRDEEQAFCFLIFPYDS